MDTCQQGVWYDILDRVINGLLLPFYLNLVYCLYTGKKISASLNLSRGGGNKGLFLR